ncbi:MAG: adenylate kinase family protein [Candidatus Woesearchaeota archaeon]
MKVVCVTGTPCVGKTTFARKLADHLGFRYLDVGKFIRDNNLSEGYDSHLQCDIVDEEKLTDALVGSLDAKEGIILDSHMSHLMPSSRVDLCIVLKAPLKTLKARLEARGYPSYKVRENLDAEIFDVCHVEAVEAGHKVFVLENPDESSLDKVANLL